MDLSAKATSSSRARASQAVPSATTPARVTRLRATKDTPSSRPTKHEPAGLLARGKEGFRKVSDKINQGKDKDVVQTSQPTEALQAFLRIRPQPADARVCAPYLVPQTGQTVLMQMPTEGARGIPKPPHVYSFDRVFAPETSQSGFFTATTLPLVEKLLQGENGLMFAYGVSNSGKSYTIQGAQSGSAEERGVLPRAIDVVFNSIKGHESDANLKCQGLADVAFSNEPDGPLNLPLTYETSISDSVKVDRNFSYAVFVSYVEVYNEKIFDLLEAVTPTLASGTQRQSRLGLPNKHGMSGFASSMSLAAIADNGVLRRKALALKNDPEGSGKYIGGLNEVRVRTREEALAVFRQGQGARQVFGTMANSESSRSHGVFTLKVVRIHNGAPNDPESAHVSRLAIVDLAGSERTRNTATTGERLKEAGNINTSLMVLGQCLEVLRANQQRVAAPGPLGKRKLAVVPFRHSKLTELFQSFFVGDGRAVMVVHVNPFDTGYDENAHVMRFSAIAREVQTTATAGGRLKRQISSQLSAAFRQVVAPKHKVRVAVQKDVPVAGGGGGGGKSRETGGFVMVEEEFEVVVEEDEGDEHEQDAFVEYLLELLRESKRQAYESEMRVATIEDEVREECAQEMQAKLAEMEAAHRRRINDTMAAGELKADQKLDIVSRTMAQDESFDESFQTTLDDSAVFASARTSATDDPFVVKPAAVKAPVASDDESDDELARSLVENSIFVDGDEEEEDDDESEDADDAVARPRNSRITPVATAGTPADTTLDESDVDDEEEADDDDEDESSEDDAAADDDDDEEGEDDDDDDEDDESASESEFDASSAEEASSDESPVRRMSVRRRVTGSPQRAAAAAALRSPSKKAAAATPAKRTVVTHAASARQAAEAKQATPVRGASKKHAKAAASPAAVLRDSTRQDDDDRGDASDSSDALPVMSVKKKKRTLGKSLVMEDDMAHDVRGPEVRRMVR